LRSDEVVEEAVPAAALCEVEAQCLGHMEVAELELARLGQ
jgi:hypothetical protein